MRIYSAGQNVPAYFPNSFRMIQLIFAFHKQPFGMDNNFTIFVQYKQTAYAFPAELVTYGYSYRINAEISNSIISFEPDEERNFRAVQLPGNINVQKEFDKELLEAIAAEIVSMFK